MEFGLRKEQLEAHDVPVESDAAIEIADDDSHIADAVVHWSGPSCIVCARLVHRRAARYRQNDR